MPGHSRNHEVGRAHETSSVSGMHAATNAAVVAGAFSKMSWPHLQLGCEIDRGRGVHAASTPPGNITLKRAEACVENAPPWLVVVVVLVLVLGFSRGFRGRGGGRERGGCNALAFFTQTLKPALRRRPQFRLNRSKSPLHPSLPASASPGSPPGASRSRRGPNRRPSRPGRCSFRRRCADP